MRVIPLDMVADWQPEATETLFGDIAKDLAALAAVVAFCGLIGSVAILFA